MSVSGIGSTPNSADLLALLRQQHSAKQANSASNIAKLLGNDGGSQGSTAPSGSTSATGDTPAATTTGSGTSPLSQTVLAALIDAQGQQSSGTGGPADPHSFGRKLFDSVDTNGDGQISQPELESAFTASGATAAQADASFSKLDKNGDGSLSNGELSAGIHAHHGHHHGAPAGGSESSDSLAALLQAVGGAAAADGTAQSTTGTDGSTTTTLAYADGTTVTLTVPGTSADSSTSDGTVSAASGDGTANKPTPSKAESLLTTLIKLQEQAFQAVDPTAQATTALAA